MTDHHGQLPVAPRMPYLPGSPAWWQAYRAILDEYSTIAEASYPLLVALFAREGGNGSWGAGTPPISDPEALAAEVLYDAWARMAWDWRGVDGPSWVSALYRYGLTKWRWHARRLHQQGRMGDHRDIFLSEMTNGHDEATSVEEVLELRMRVRLQAQDVPTASDGYYAALDSMVASLAGETQVDLPASVIEALEEQARLVREGMDSRAALHFSLLTLLAHRPWPGLRALLGPVRQMQVRLLAQAILEGRVRQRWGIDKDVARALGIGIPAAKRALSSLREVAEALLGAGEEGGARAV